MDMNRDLMEEMRVQKQMAEDMLDDGVRQQQVSWCSSLPCVALVMSNHYLLLEHKVDKDGVTAVVSNFSL